MKIICPHCQFTKNIPSEKLPSKPSNVICPACKKKFLFLPAKPELTTKVIEANIGDPTPEKVVKKASSKKALYLRLVAYSCVLLFFAGSYFFMNYEIVYDEPVEQPVARHLPKPPQKVELFPAVATASAWGKVLNPEALAPNNQFKAYYINTESPQSAVATDFAKDISVNYIYDKLHGIPSKDFGAYWIGNIHFDKDESREISVAQSHAETRIYIDGKEILGQGTGQKVKHLFTKGLHTIEVEHLNNWHTTDLLVSILPIVPFTSPQEAAIMVKGTRAEAIWYASVYESARMDHKVDLELQETDGPVALFLSSYGPVHWNLKNIDQSQSITVFYSSYHNGSSVSANKRITTKKLLFKDLSSARKLVPECRQTGAIFHCDGEKDFPRVLKQFEILTRGKKFDGYTGRYSAETLVIPEIVMDEEKFLDIKKQYDEIELKRQQITKRSLDNVY